MTGPYTEPAFDPAASGPQPSAEEIERAARDSVKSGVDIRQRIHDVTLLALQSRRFDRHGMREVVRAVTERHGASARSRAGPICARRWPKRSAAWTTRSRAPRKRAAARCAQLAVTGKDLSDTEIKQALATMKRLEDDFLATAGHAAEATSEQDAAGAAQDPGEPRARRGTETGTHRRGTA